MAIFLRTSLSLFISRLSLWSFCFIFFSNPSLSQLSELSFRNYTTRDGLPGNNINFIFQDSRRFLWIATNEGLSRFDGKIFKNYYHNSREINSIPSNAVQSILEYKKGFLLISCFGGTRCYDLLADTFFLPQNALLRNNGFKNATRDSGGNFWLIIDNKLLVADSNLVVNKTIHFDYGIYKRLLAIHFSSSPKIILSTGNGFYNVDTTGNKCATHRMKTLEKIPAAGLVFSYFDEKQNRLITGTQTDIYFINLSTDGVILFPDGNCDSCNSGEPKNAFTDSEGKLWIYYQKSGVALYDESKKRLKRIMHQDRIASSLIDNYVWAFFEDDEKNIWIGTKKGLSKLSRQIRHISFYRQPFEMNGQRDELYDLTIGNDDNIYIAANKNHFFQFNPKTGNTLNFGKTTGYSAKAIGDSILLTGKHSKDILIYDSKRKSFSYDKKLRAFFPSKFGLILFSYKDSYGDWWWSIHNAGLVHKPRGKTYKQYHNLQVPAPFKFGWFTHITEDEYGNMWFNGRSKTLLCWLRKENRFAEIEPGTMNNSEIHALMADKKGNIWIGTEGSGLIKYEIKTKRFMRYSKENGLTSNLVYSLVMDKADRLWIGGTGGLSCFIDNENRVVNFNQEDGLPEGILNEGPEFYDTAANRVYMAAYDFLFSFCPDSLLNLSSKKLPLYIEAIWINGVKHSVKNSSLILRHHENDLRIDFATIELTSSQPPMFAYQLAGIDKSWQYSKDISTVNYNSLAEGRYLFRIKVKKAGSQQWSELPHPLQIIIRPAWWQTWWFYSAVALLVFTVAYISMREIIYHKLERQRLALGKQKAIESERVRISSELHDDLGGGLSTIRLMSELIQHGDKKDESKKQLEKISSNSKELVQKMNEIIWALNIKNDNLAGLLAYIRQYAVRFLDDNVLECNLSVPEQIPDLSVAGSRRRDIFLLVKESLNNAVKHARATKVDIVFTIDDLLQIKIHDDGVGFDAAKLTTTSNGLRNMGKRVDALTGTMTIKNHQGTTLIFDIPLKNLSHESVQ